MGLLRSRATTRARIGLRRSKTLSVKRARCLAPSPRSYGERGGVRGILTNTTLLENPPHPRLRRDLSPHAGRGEEHKPDYDLDRLRHAFARHHFAREDIDG